MVNRQSMNMKRKKVKKINKNKLFVGTVKLRTRIWFYLTCLRPVTKYEFLNLQLKLITIVEGIQDSDLQHYQTEKAIIDKLKELADIVTGDNHKKQSDKNKDEKPMYG